MTPLLSPPTWPYYQQVLLGVGANVVKVPQVLEHANIRGAAYFDSIQ